MKREASKTRFVGRVKVRLKNTFEERGNQCDHDVAMKM